MLCGNLGLLSSRSRHSEASYPLGIFVQPNHLTFLNEGWYVGASSWPGVSCEKASHLEGQGQNVGSNPHKINSKFWTFCNRTWYSGASSQARVLCDKFGLLKVIVKATVRVDICKKKKNSWQYRYSEPLNESWYVGVWSWLGVSCKKFECLSSRSRSHCKLKSSKNIHSISPELWNILQPNMTVWYSGAPSTCCHQT